MGVYMVVKQKVKGFDEDVRGIMDFGDDEEYKNKKYNDTRVVDGLKEVGTLGFNVETPGGFRYSTMCTMENRG